MHQFSGYLKIDGIYDIIKPMNYWLVKSDPSEYSWEDLLRDGSTYWDGVRNYQARNNLRDMDKGDKVLFYHSGDVEVVGIAKVTKEAYQDPTTDDDRWVVVDLEPVETLDNPVSLSEIKGDKRLQETALVRQSRLSVMPLSEEEFGIIVDKGNG